MDNTAIDNKRPKNVLLSLFTIILWLISSVIGFLLIIPILDSITRIYAAFWADPSPIGQAFFLGVSIRNITLFILAILLLIGTIGGAEHHFRNMNTPTSWHVMFITYIILLTAFLLTISF